MALLRKKKDGTSGRRPLASIAVYSLVFLVAVMFIDVHGAWAAYDQFRDQMGNATCEAFGAGKKILYAAAALALLIGLAPLLWGEIKGKWIVSCVVFAIVLPLIPTVVSGFTGQAMSC